MDAASALEKIHLRLVGDLDADRLALHGNAYLYAPFYVSFPVEAAVKSGFHRHSKNTGQIERCERTHVVNSNRMTV